MHVRSETADREAPDALGRRIGRTHLGMGFFEIDEVAQLRVVRGIGDRGIVEHVIAVVRVLDLRA